MAHTARRCVHTRIGACLTNGDDHCRTRPFRGWNPLVAFLFVMTAAVITGALTPLGEHHLPASVNSAANSSAPWAMVAFASVYVVRARAVFAAVLGACAFVAMDAAFSVAFRWEFGYHYANHYLLFWTGIAVIVGPLVGLCASWLRAPQPILRAIGVAAPSSILIGEGVFMLVHLPGVSTLYSVACVLGGLLLFVIVAAAKLRRFSHFVVSLAICAAASVLFYSVYSLLPLILHKTVP
jgi:hypothetical protein